VPRRAWQQLACFRQWRSRGSGALGVLTCLWLSRALTKNKSSLHRLMVGSAQVLRGVS
jgi:hypothetical protein